MDFALEGHRWWSLIILDGYSRTMLAGAVAPSEASWVALTVLYTACRRYGVPDHLISDSGGAFISDAFEGVCTRLGIDHHTIVSTQGQSYMNLMETHFNIQRRLYDYQFSLTRTPLEFEQAHQDFLELYNTTAHQGLLKEQFRLPIPLQVLGEATGRAVYARGARAQVRPRPLSAHHQSLWLCHLAPLPLLCGPGVAPDAGVAVGVRPGPAGGV